MGIFLFLVTNWGQAKRYPTAAALEEPKHALDDAQSLEKVAVGSVSRIFAPAFAISEGRGGDIDCAKLTKGAKSYCKDA